MTAADFADIARRLLEADDWLVEDVEPGVLRVSPPGESESTVSFHNLRQGDGESADAAVQRFLRSIVSPGDAPALTPGDVIPVVKDHRALQGMREAGADIAFEHLAGELWVVFVHDMPERMAFLGEDALEAIGLDPETRRGAAVRNLREAVSIDEHGDIGTLRMLTCGGAYEASLLVDAEFWREREAADPGLGPCVAVAPARDLLFTARMGDTEGVAGLMDVLAKVRRDPSINYALDGGPMAFVDGAWAPVDIQVNAAEAPGDESERPAPQEWIALAALAQLVLFLAVSVLAWRWLDLLPVDEPPRWTRYLPTAVMVVHWQA